MRMSASTPPRTISLAWLTRFWRDPAKARLRDEAGVSLDALDSEVWPDREPLSAAIDRRERVESSLLLDALNRGVSELSTMAPDWLSRSGMLAAGAIGERAYARARERAQAALVAAREFLGAAPQAQTQPVDLDLGAGIRLSGNADAFRCADGCLRVFGAKPGGMAMFNELLPFYVRMAALRLSSPDGVAADFVEFERNLRKPALLRPILAQDSVQLRAGLRRLIDAAVAADTGLLFPPRTAWEWVNAAPDKRERAARIRWEGNDFTRRGERDYAGYAALIARDQDFLDPRAPAHARFAAACALVADVLDPGREVLLRETEKPRRRKA